MFSVGHAMLDELGVTVSIVPEEGSTARVTVRTRVSIPWWDAIVTRVAGWEIRTLYIANGHRTITLPVHHHTPTPTGMS